MPQDTTVRWISADLAITRADEAPLTSDDADQVIDVVVEALEHAGYDVFGTTEIRTAPTEVVLAQIQEIAGRLLAQTEAH
jgi:hypothetical protein